MTFTDNEQIEREFWDAYFLEETEENKIQEVKNGNS